jgi:hypothetical protein
MTLWALLSPLVIALARRFPFRRGRILRAVAVHVPVAFVLSIAHAFIGGSFFVAMGFFPNREMPVPRLLGGMALGKLHNNLFTYFAIVAVTHALDLWRRYRERELLASRLEARLAEARLDVLRMQLQPHFLFNTLHAVSTLMHRDPAAADRTLARLSDLLRLAMEHNDARDVPLAREVEFLSGYLEIQQTRFGDRLRCRMHVDPAALDVRVPPLLLQPLVENAIRHGIGERAGGGTVAIDARVSDRTLAIEIHDDGVGYSEPAGNGGRGVANTRARLQHAYGAAHRFEIGAAPSGGTIVRIEVPARTEPSAADAAERTEP